MTDFPVTIRATDGIGRVAEKSVLFRLRHFGFNPLALGGASLVGDLFKQVNGPGILTTIYANRALTGKRYWETTVATPASDSDGAGISIADLGGWVGESANSCAIYCKVNDVYRGSGVPIRNFANTTGNTVSWKHAYDAATRRYWIGIAGGAWYIGDPVAGTSPVTTMPSGTYYPAVSLSGPGATCVINGGDDPFIDSPPAGFAGFAT